MFTFTSEELSVLIKTVAFLQRHSDYQKVGALLIREDSKSENFEELIEEIDGSVTSLLDVLSTGDPDVLELFSTEEIIELSKESL